MFADIVRLNRQLAMFVTAIDQNRKLHAPRPAEQLAKDRANLPSQNVQQQELVGIVQEALEGLNERQRVAVILNKFEDMNYAEIAEVMGLSAKAVKSLLSRARSRLRDVLQDYIYMDSAPVPPPPADADAD